MIALAETFAAPESLQAFLRGEVRRLTPREADLVYAIGSAFYEQEDHAAAVDVFRLLVLGAPESARSWTSLAILHDAQHDADRAIPLYQIACAAPEGLEWRDRARLYLARAFWAASRFDEAAEQHELVDEQELAPELSDLYAELATELRRGRLS
jgi:lipopolysaccharide biosynthesis regulator YciM